MNVLVKSLSLLALLTMSALANAFDLQQLSAQLAKPDVIHGQFVQENTCVPCPSR
jgi:hypothetical protein